MSNVPNWVDGKTNKERFREPWTVPLSSSEAAGFKKALWDHGFLSPNFRRREAVSKKGARCPESPVPDGLRHKAQYHAFALERVRHRLGDRSLSPLSWYRSPCHNQEVGGASQSEHMEAHATDWSDSERIRLGSSDFNREMNRQFANGGRGTANGNIRHVDNGDARTWVY